MTPERAEHALSKARRAYAHAMRALMADDISEAARHRHARRARVAASRIADARRDLAHLACDWAEIRALAS